MDDPFHGFKRKKNIFGLPEYQDEEFEEFDIVLDYIEANPLDIVAFTLKKHRASKTNKLSLWETSWGQMLRDPLLLNPKSAVVSCYILCHVSFLIDFINRPKLL